MNISGVALILERPTMSSKLLRLEEVLARVPISKSSVLRQVSEGLFPRPVRVGERRVAWVEDEIIAWQAERIAARDEPSVAGHAA
jgi:prophage regulatory protein